MTHETGRIAPLRRSWAIALLAAIAALMLIAAGCGGDDDDSTAAGGSAGGGGSAKLDEAQQIADKWEKRPTQITQTKPIDKPIPEGKKITFISCGVEACAVQGKILSDGASVLGWSVKTVNTDGSPERINGAFESAIRDGADAVILNAADPNQIAKPLKDAKKAGVEFVTCCSTAPPGTFLHNTGTTEQGGRVGQAHAAKIIVDSGGKANVLFVNLSAFAILGEVGTEFDKTLDDLCPDCKHATIDIPLTALGKDVPDRIVSYLRSHPDVNYIFLVEGALAPGVKPALQAAGLADKVKIASQNGNEAIYAELAQGDPWLAITPGVLYSYDYNMLDALARKFAGVPVVEDTLPDLWLMTPKTVPKDAGAVIQIQDYKAQFSKLWGKSG